MKEKAIIKFKSDYSKGAMHQITFNGKKVSITMRDSRKVKHLNEKGSLLIAPSLISRKFEDIKIEVVDNESYTNEVFEYMLNMKHTHYKKSPEGLVVLEYI